MYCQTILLLAATVEEIFHHQEHRNLHTALGIVNNTAASCYRETDVLSSGAHKCTYSFRYRQPIPLLASTVEEMEHLFHGSSIS
jgi:hypothetical protein